MTKIITKVYKSLLTYFYYDKYEKDLIKARKKAYELTRIICFLGVTIPICLILVFGYDTYHEYLKDKGLAFKLFQYTLGLLLFFIATRFFRKEMEMDFDSIAIGRCDESKSGVKCLTYGGVSFVILNISLVFVIQYFFK